MNTIVQFKKDLVQAAKRLGDINDFSVWPKDETKLANGYIAAEEAGDEFMREAYIAGLMLRHWKDVNRLYTKCRTCDSRNTLADFTTIIYERIMYAFKYRAWLKEGTKLNAQQCINMAISTEVKNQMYFSNLQKNLSNATVNNVSLDKTIGNSTDDRETTIADTIADPDSDSFAFSKVDGIIQEYLNKNKIIEAIVIVTISNNPTMRVTTETKVEDRVVETFDKDLNKWVVEKNEDGSVKMEKVKYKVNYIEPWRFKAAEFLMNLPESYVEEFQKRFKVSAELLIEAYNTISTARNTKVYKYLDNTLAELRNNKEAILQMLR